MNLEEYLKKEGFSIERLALYAIIHHDHHFIAGWGDEEALLAYDNIRRKIETNFDDFYFFLSRTKEFIKGEIRGICHFLKPAHEWSMNLWERSMSKCKKYGKEEVKVG